MLGGENISDDVKTNAHYEPTDKFGLFEYLKQQTESCEIPNKGGKIGGKIKFTKKRRYKSKKKTLKRVFN